MKKILVLLLLLITGHSMAQDTLVFRNMTKEIVKITEVSDSEIKYKMHDYLDGPTFIMPKSKLYSIIYANGKEQRFAIERNINKQPINGKKTKEKIQYKKVKSRNILWASYTLSIIPFRTEVYTTSGDNKFQMHKIECLHGTKIGYNRVELIANRIPLYIKSGIEVGYSTSGWIIDRWQLNAPFEIVDGTFINTSLLRVGIPVNISYEFETSKISIAPYIGASVGINAIAQQQTKEHRLATDEQIRTTNLGNLITISCNAGTDVYLKSGLYFGVNLSVEALSSYRNYLFSQPHIIDFDFKIGYTF